MWPRLRPWILRVVLSPPGWQSSAALSSQVLQMEQHLQDAVCPNNKYQRINTAERHKPRSSPPPHSAQTCDSSRSKAPSDQLPIIRSDQFRNCDDSTSSVLLVCRLLLCCPQQESPRTSEDIWWNSLYLHYSSSWSLCWLFFSPFLPSTLPQKMFCLRLLIDTLRTARLRWGSLWGGAQVFYCEGM